MLQPLIKLLRPHQYIKNGFVFLGIVFAPAWELPMLLAATLAFLAFCAMASAVYVLNDIIDVEADRNHPVKRHRPLASQAISIPTAWAIFASAVMIALILAALVSTGVTALVLSYLILNVAYSWWLKHIVILDVFSIAGGFMLRILAGTLGLSIEPSHWLLLCGLMLTLFLGFAKRRAELADAAIAAAPEGGRSRRVLGDYSLPLLDQLIAISAACTVLAYGLYTVSADTLVTNNGNPYLILTLPFVIYGIFRYLFLLHVRGHGNDTSRDLLTDPHLLFTVLLWLGATIVIPQ